MSQDGRQIFYLNITTFSLSVERVLDSSLKERPLVMAPLNSERAVVWEASKEAKQEGITKGMALAEAKKLCKSLKVIPPRIDLYKRMNQKLEEKILLKTTPVYEIEKMGHVYLDLTGFKKLYGPLEDYARRLQNNILEEFKLSPSVGSSANKLVSKVAAKCAVLNKEILLVSKGEEEKFLSPLSVDVLPPIKELKKRQKDKDGPLEDLNICTVKDILNLDPLSLNVAFGSLSENIFHMARGIDYTAVVPSLNKEKIFEETYLKEDSNDLIYLRRIIDQLLDRATTRLRSEGIYVRTISLSLRYSDYKFSSRRMNLKKNVQEFNELKILFNDLFNKVFTRRTRVQFIALEFEDLVKNEIQLSLFEEKRKESHLFEAIDSVRHKFGNKLISFG